MGIQGVLALRGRCTGLQAGLRARGLGDGGQIPPARSPVPPTVTRRGRGGTLPRVRSSGAGRPGARQAGAAPRDWPC